MSTIAVSEIVDILRSLFPKGKLYDFYVASSNVHKLLSGTADTLQSYCYDILDTMRTEFNPATATTAQKLPDYETALGLTTTFTATKGTQAQRQAGVISKLRESGAFTAANVRAIIGPLLGYTNPGELLVIECDRSALKALNTHAGSAFSVLASATGTSTVAVYDGGTISAAGAQLQIAFSTATMGWADINMSLTSPAGTVYSWPAGTLSGTDLSALTWQANVVSGFAGEAIAGTWTLTIDNIGPNTADITSWSLFVEGIGAGLCTGGAVFEWGVYADPSLVNSPDNGSVVDALIRIKHAHTNGSVILSASPWPDTDTGTHAAIPDSCIPV